MHLFQALAERVNNWRDSQYSCDDHPIINEILDWATNPQVSGFKLRAPQLLALETYWYLRLIEKTPHILDLYQRLIPDNASRMEALGINHPDLKDIAINKNFDGLLNDIRQDDELVKRFHLEALRETLEIEYPSYIMALAMGAGKTILIGSIFASEFAMAQEYPRSQFVKNALVFAPGKTIIESLRELAAMRFDAILPPRMYKHFAASVKITFTRDGDPTIPIIQGSSYNVVVTNTEKIRIQKETIRKSEIGNLFSNQREDEARAEVANLRLQAIASLPNLAIFSDEAHHLYGQSMDSELKKVRKTVDYLYNPHSSNSELRENHKTNLIAVVNTTGTPYFKHQVLKEVVVWYGLSQGIQDGILKEVSGNIKGFDLEGDTASYLDFVLRDFFGHYRDVRLPNGTPAKLAIFFPQTDDAGQLRASVETSMASMGLPITWIVEHHSAHEQKEEFDRFKTSEQRVALLVNRGVEGWDVPALFGCALARKLKSSNNFVLQAASRCLRQVPGNRAKAAIYLSMDNRSILDKQLQETYGETVSQLNQQSTRTRKEIIQLRKVDVPPLVVRQKVRTVVPKATTKPEMVFNPVDLSKQKAKVTVFALSNQKSNPQTLRETQSEYELDIVERMIDLYSAAVELAANYHGNAYQIHEALRKAYPESTEIPMRALDGLAAQLETATADYEIKEEIVEIALALIKPDGFSLQKDDQGVETWTAEISVPIDREHLLTRWKDWREKAGEFGFHYDPYNFDSGPEQNFFEEVLNLLKVKPDEIEDIYFTGALTDPEKTDFYLHYRGEDSGWHRYSPDFLIRRKDGRCLIVEIKAENKRQDNVEGEHGVKSMAMRKWVDLNPDLLKYEMIFVRSDALGYDQLKNTREIIDV